MRRFLSSLSLSSETRRRFFSFFIGRGLSAKIDGVERSRARVFGVAGGAVLMRSQLFTN
jgi:hypothetical protein